MPVRDRHPAVQLVLDQPQDAMTRLRNQARKRSPPATLTGRIGEALASRNINSQLPEKRIADAIFRPTPMMEIHVIDQNGKTRAPADTWSITAQFNPAEVERSIKVTWAELKPPGLPHSVLHYVGTESQGLKFSLYFDALKLIGGKKSEVRGGFRQGEINAGNDVLTAGKKVIVNALAFLESAAYPPARDAKGAGTGISTGAPPRLLFFWPNFLSLTCFLSSLSYKTTDWDSTGAPIRITAEIDLREIGNVRLLTTDAIRKNKVGSRAAWTPQGVTSKTG